MTNFFITSVTYYEKCIDSRCIGYLPSFKEAESAILNDNGTISEDGTFNYVVIEEMHMGVIALINYINKQPAQFWYKLNQNTQRFEKIKTPTWANGIINWGIG